MTMKPYILCCGANGRCVIYTRLANEPNLGESARCPQGARMILRWTNIGLLGTAAVGPAAGSRLSYPTVGDHQTPPVQGWLPCSEDAARAMEEWSSWEG